MTQHTPPDEKGQYLNPASAAPKYFHFATVICQRFCHLPVGTVLPALTELAKRFSVSKETINRSMRYLAQRGYVKSERGRGTYILRDLRDALGTPVETVPPGPEAAAGPATATAGGRSIGLILKARPGMDFPDRHIAEIEIVAGLQHRLQQEGITLATLVVSDSGPYDLERQLTSHPSIGGYIFMTQILNRGEAERVAALQCPAVVINEEEFSDILTCITACEAEGVRQLVRRLHDLGHRKIVYLARGNDRHLDRFRGFEQAVGQLPGMQGAIHETGTRAGQIEAVEEQTGAILKKFPGYTAYIAGGTEVPHFFCRGLRALGLTPGKEISVAGFGISSPEWNSIAEGHDKLTAVIKPRYEMGVCAAETLLNQSRQKYQQSGVIRIPTSVQEGTTTGKVYRGKLPAAKRSG